MVENRKSYRLPLRTKFIYSDSKQVLVGNTVNISEGGVFISSVGPHSVTRETVCQCLFIIQNNDAPVSIRAVVKRVVSSSSNPEEVPGVGFSFLLENKESASRLREFVLEMRRNFEVVSTVLSAGEPEIGTLLPMVSQMHLPPYSDIGELRTIVERVLRAIEFVENEASAP